MQGILKFDHVHFQYDVFANLEGVCFEVFERVFLGIFGPKVGGKTTLLKLIGGELKPDRGVISLWDHPPEEVSDQIGYVPQVAPFDQKFPISVLDVVKMGCLSELTLWGRFPKQVKEKAIAA